VCRLDVMYDSPTTRCSRCCARRITLGDKPATRIPRPKPRKIEMLVVGPPGLEPGSTRRNRSNYKRLGCRKRSWRQAGVNSCGTTGAARRIHVRRSLRGNSK
jgi:hypothetical protein